MKKYVFILIASIFVIPFTVNAQEEMPQQIAEDPININENSAKVENPPMPTQEDVERLREKSGYNDFAEGSDVKNKEPECFDYYTFQSVQVSLETEKDNFEPGEIVEMSGQVFNNNNYPVVDGNVFVRVSQKNGNYQEEGNFIIDEFIAVEDIAIDKNSAKEISFEWNVPESAVASEYIFDYFFSVGKKFNLGGLPFSNEIIIGQTAFDVVSEQTAFVSFDRSNTKVNDISYQHIGDWPRVFPGEKAVIVQPIVNSYNQDKDVEITYELYYWDSLNEEDLLDTKKENITISANDKSEVIYEIPEMNDSVYYLKITAKSDDIQSIVNVRVVSNQSHPRLNYPAITKFPIKKGDDFTLFSCFHNGADSPASGKVEIKIYDKDEKEIGRVVYSGGISSAMMLAKKDLIAQNDYEYIKLKANIFDNNNEIIDQYEVIYNCKDFNNCKKQESETTSSAFKNIMFVFALLLPIIIVIYLIISRRKNR